MFPCAGLGTLGNLWLGISNIKLKYFCKAFKIVVFMSDYVKWKKPIWKYDSNYKTFWKRQNYPDCKRSVVARALGREEWIIRAQGIFRTMKILYDTVMMDTCHTFVQTSKMDSTKGEPWCKLWVTMMCHCRFISHLKQMSLSGGTVDNGGSCPYVGTGICGKSLYLPFSFAVNPKLS